jgi:hypothetical protein
VLLGEGTYAAFCAAATLANQVALSVLRPELNGRASVLPLNALFRLVRKVMLASTAHEAGRRRSPLAAATS